MPVTPHDPPPSGGGSSLDLTAPGGGETFQHYQVLRRPDGRLWELGRGAMGVTYKAFDTNLRCHVALKGVPFHPRTIPRPPAVPPPTGSPSRRSRASGPDGAPRACGAEAPRG